MSPKRMIHGRSFKVSWKQIHLKNGYITFEKSINEFKSSFEFEIKCDHIKEEYDAIKPYFANSLGLKQIEVYSLFDVSPDNSSAFETSSKDIERINEETINNVKIELIKASLANKKRVNDMLDYSMDEFLINNTKGKIGIKTLNFTEEEVFEKIISISDTRHYKHLLFLSENHEHSIMKLRIFLNPISFLFLIKGVKQYHFIWETLNTEEASYIWHIKKDINELKSNFETIKNTIIDMKVNGKSDYIKSKNHDFIRVTHEYSEGDNGFAKWVRDIKRNIELY